MRDAGAAGITIMEFSIFKAFPEAIISGVWQIGTCQHGTIVGNQFTKIAEIDVIVDEGNRSTVNTTPEAIGSNMLVYACPDQMPTVNTNELVSNYMLYNSETDGYYLIIDAGIGKNQHGGYIEHIELELEQTEVADV